MYKFVASINTYPDFRYLLPKMNRTYPIHIIKDALGNINKHNKQAVLRNNKRLNIDKISFWYSGLCNEYNEYNDNKWHRHQDIYH
jgi:hypothetical protein